MSCFNQLLAYGASFRPVEELLFCCLLCIESVCFEDQHFPICTHYNPYVLLHIVSKTAAWWLELLVWNLLLMERGQKCGSIKYLGFHQNISLPSAFKHQIQSTVRPSMPVIDTLHNPGLGWSRNFDCFCCLVKWLIFQVFCLFYQ